MRTRIVQLGNNQAVLIPKELQFEQTDIEYDIKRQGDRLIITPVSQSPANAMELFSAFSDDFMAEGRLEQGTQKRDDIS